MQANTALSQAMRDLVLPSSRLKGEANVLVMPNLDAANIAYTMTMIMADTLPVGPILIGAAKPAHILTPSVTARGIINMTAVSVAEAQGNGYKNGDRIPGAGEIVECFRASWNCVKISVLQEFVLGEFPDERQTAKLRQSPERGQCARRDVLLADTVRFFLLSPSRRVG